jgi:hypothetical protein
MKFIDMSGQRVGHLMVLEPFGKSGIYITYWCKCDCGRYKEIRGHNLRGSPTRKSTQTCGHPKCKYHVALMRRKHKYSCHKHVYLYLIYRNKENTFKSFDHLMEVVGKRVGNKFLTQRDYSKPLGPDNFVWVKDRGRAITYKGRRYSINKWAKVIGITRQRFDQRLQSGQTAEEILEFYNV